MLFVIKQALKIKNYEVETRNSFDGIDAIMKISPDLIFLDISLVNNDGREVSKAIKNNKATENIPIIIITAHSNADELAKKAGADNYISKPFDLKILWKMADEYTTKKMQN